MGVERAVRTGIAAVWIVNGLYAKVLNRVPRHTQIVGQVLGDGWARPITVTIGLGEVALGTWVLLGRRPRETAALQIGLVSSMNVLEAVRARDLLLFGRLNAFYAACFCATVYVHGFHLAAEGDGTHGSKPT